MGAIKLLNTCSSTLKYILQNWNILHNLIYLLNTVNSGYNEPVYTENLIYWTIYCRTEFFIINQAGYNEFI